MSTAAVVAVSNVPLYKGAAKAFDSLEEIAFDVVKINHYGRRQRRILKLTRNGIQNIKNHSTVTKQFQYTNVENVHLQSADEVRISYNNDHDFVYKSPIAVRIARELSNRLLLHRCVAFEQIAVDYQRIMQETDQPDTLRSPRESVEGLNLLLTGGATNAAQLLALKSENEAEKISEIVSAWLLSKDEPEGRTIHQFIRKFNSDTKKLTQTTSSSSSATTTNSNSNENNNNNNNSVGDEVMAKIRQFLDGVMAYVLEKRVGEIREALGHFVDIDRIQEVVEYSLQQVILLPLYDEIRAIVRNEMMRKRENILCVKFLCLRSLHQLGFGIRESMLSPSNWALAVQELQLINSCRAPCDMLRAVLGCARMIYSLHYHEHPNKREIIGADDFLPIFIFVACQACIESPLFLTDILWGLSDSRTLSGEGGYYITVLQSAMHHLRLMDFDAAFKDAEQLLRETHTTVESPKLSLNITNTALNNTNNANTTNTASTNSANNNFHSRLLPISPLFTMPSPSVFSSSIPVQIEHSQQQQQQQRMSSTSDAGNSLSSAKSSSLRFSGNEKQDLGGKLSLQAQFVNQEVLGRVSTRNNSRSDYVSKGRASILDGEKSDNSRNQSSEVNASTTDDIRPPPRIQRGFKRFVRSRSLPCVLQLYVIPKQSHMDNMLVKRFSRVGNAIHRPSNISTVSTHGSVSTNTTFSRPYFSTEEPFPNQSSDLRMPTMRGGGGGGHDLSNPYRNTMPAESLQALVEALDFSGSGHGELMRNPSQPVFVMPSKKV